MNLKTSYIATATLLLTSLVQAQPTAHYVPGIEGLKAATLPPPGLYLRDYNVGYYSDRLNDSSGDKVSGVDAELFVYANVPRVLWITDYKLLGGFIGVDALLPIQYTDLEVDTPIGDFDDDDFGIGDFFAEVTWSWHLKQWDFSLAYGLWMPTGDSDDVDVEAGLGYWGNMFTAGATFYPDAGKKWSISALNRYEINTEDRDTDIRPGDAWTIEGGVSRALSPTVDVGVIGYYQRQVTDDSGDGSTNERDEVAGVGPEVSVFYPKITLGWSLRYAYEFLAEDRLQGHTAVLTITKRF